MDLGGLFVSLERRDPLIKLAYLLLRYLLNILPEPLLPLPYPLYLLIYLAHFLRSRPSRHDIKSLFGVHLLVFLIGGRVCRRQGGRLGPGHCRRVDAESRRSLDSLVVFAQGVGLTRFHIYRQHFKDDIFHLL